MRGMGTDHVISGQVRGLKKTASNGANKQTNRRTSQLLDWIGPVGQFIEMCEKVLEKASEKFEKMCKKWGENKDKNVEKV